MTRRFCYPLFGNRYCGNNKKKEVHDLEKEKSECQIDNIIYTGHLRAFNPDTLQQAHSEKYENCPFCIRGSRWEKINSK